MRRLALAGLLLFLVSGSVGARSDDNTDAKKEPTPPNVLIVITDDERIQSNVATPALYEWFKKGTIFSRAYATTPHCCPSRASIFTGQYTHNHRVARPGLIPLLDHTETMQYHLRKSGYLTGYVGKFLNTWPLYTQPPYFGSWTVGEGYKNARFVSDGEPRVIEYGPSFVFDQGGDYIETWEANDDKPWLLMLSPSAPHSPYEARAKRSTEEFPWAGTPATKEQDRSDKPPYVRSQYHSESEGAALRAKQLRTLRTVDTKFIETIELLKEHDELDRTLVIYISDNGFTWGEHGTLDKGMPYTGSTRVPLYMRGPGVPSKVSDRLVANIDVAPTVYEATGIEPTYAVDGRPLLQSDRERLLLEYAGTKIVPKWSSLVSRDAQYVEYADGFREFYDLENDPFQLENRPEAASTDLREALRAARTCAGRACP